MRGIFLKTRCKRGMQGPCVSDSRQRRNDESGERRSVAARPEAHHTQVRHLQFRRSTRVFILFLVLQNFQEINIFFFLNLRTA